MYVYIWFLQNIKVAFVCIKAAWCRLQAASCCRLYGLIHGNKHKVNFHIGVPPANLELFSQRHCLKCRQKPCKVLPCRSAVMPLRWECGWDLQFVSEQWSGHGTDCNGIIWKLWFWLSGLPPPDLFQFGGLGLVCFFCFFFHMCHVWP